MILKDNTSCSSTADTLEEYLSLQNIANRDISDLLDENGNSLLIYPQSFCQCEDEMGRQQVLSLQSHWKEKLCTKVTVQTGNIAGFVGVNGHSFSIHSRFSPNAEEDFFLHYMLRKVLCINVVSLSHGVSNDPVFDFMLYLFPKCLNDALAQGMYKEYRRNAYNDANLRGGIDINRYLKANLPFNGRVAYSTREFDYDNRVTELIRHTIDYIGKGKYGRSLLENDVETRANVLRIISATPSYNSQERERVIRSNLKIMSHPYFSRYAPLQKLCLRILRHEKIKYGVKDDKVHGIMFDVAYLWEEYLATILTKQGFSHPNNTKDTGRIYLAEHNGLPRYPDFYNEHIIVDAKYKKDIKRDDVHQMITYMYRLKGKRGVFVQPSSIESKEEKCFLLGYGKEEKSELQTYHYSIPQTSTDYKQFVDDIQLSEKLFCEKVRENFCLP